MTLVRHTESSTPTLDCRSSEISSWSIIRGKASSAREGNLRLIWGEDRGALAVLTNEEVKTSPTFVLRFNDIAQFEVLYGSQEIVISLLNKDVSEATIQHLLFDQIWPRIISQRGSLVLHAAGVSSPDGAIIFVGQSGRGKSTLAASLHQRGFTLLGDDAMVMSAVDGEVQCNAVYRSLRLFPDSIATLLEQPTSLSAVADYTRKRHVHLPVSENGNDDHRVQAIFFLNPDEDHASASVRAVLPGDACMRLVENSFWLDPTDIALSARKLKLASVLVNCVPTYQLAYPRDYSKLAELHATVVSVLR